MRSLLLRHFVGPALLAMLGGTACSSGSSSSSSTGAPATADPTTSYPGGRDAYFEGLFGKPSSSVVTPDNINGLWKGSWPSSPATTSSASSVELRLKLTTDTFVMAQQCAPGVAGLSSTARISASELAVLDTTNSNPQGAPGPAGCGFDITPIDIVRCMAASSSEAATEGLRRDSGCFFLSGDKLEFYGGGLLRDVKLSKLSD